MHPPLTSLDQATYMKTNVFHLLGAKLYQESTGIQVASEMFGRYSATSPPMKYYEFSPSIIYLMTSLYIICFWHSSQTWVECFKVKCSLILFPGSCFLPLL